MTELEQWQQMQQTLEQFKQIVSEQNTTLNSLSQTLVYIGGVVISLLLVLLFAKAWGRNT